MKPFLKKILYYIVIPIIVCHILFLLAYKLISMQVDGTLREIAKNNSTLIMGDSQMQKFSPDLIDGDVVNLATAGEHYYFTYLKLQKLAATENHKIQTILLGLSLHSFAPMLLNHFDFKHIEGKVSLKSHLFFFDLFDNEFMRPDQIILNKDFFLAVLKGPEWGGHDAFFNKNPDSLLSESGLRFIYDSPVDEKVTGAQEFYLDKIVELCKQENISLVFVSPPTHQVYKTQVDAAYYETLRRVIDNHNNLLYLNFLTDSIPSIYMSDSNHLNKEGAEIYSRKINLELKNHNPDNHVVRPVEN